MHGDIKDIDANGVLRDADGHENTRWPDNGWHGRVGLAGGCEIDGSVDATLGDFLDLLYIVRVRQGVEYVLGSRMLGLLQSALGDVETNHSVAHGLGILNPFSIDYQPRLGKLRRCSWL